MALDSDDQILEQSLQENAKIVKSVKLGREIQNVKDYSWDSTASQGEETWPVLHFYHSLHITGNAKGTRILGRTLGAVHKLCKGE